MRGLADKVVVVAGGAGGIGTASSRRLAEEGAAVVVGDLDRAAADAVAGGIKGAGGRAVAVGVDISDQSSVQALFATAVDTFGGLDRVHINAADLSPGTIGADTDAVSIDLGVFDRTLAVNLRGHLLCARTAIPLLLERGGGAMVFTSSIAAFMGEPERPSYAAAKAGIGALVRHIASRWGREGIRANAVAPGLVLTEAVLAGIDDGFRQMALSGTRSDRLGRPDDIAAAVAFLLSDEAGWINGQVLSVDGGASMR